MRPTLLIIVVQIVLAVSPAAAIARGEASYTLPEVREIAPSSQDVITSPLWTHQAAESGPNALAIGDGVVAFATTDLMCGFDGATGTRLWCDAKGIFPAYAGGTVAFTTDEGSVRGLDIKTGALLWRHAGARSRYRTASFATSTGDDFIVSGHQGMIEPGSTSFAEITPSGRVLWSGESQVPGALLGTQIFHRYAFEQLTGSGARMFSSQQLLKLGPSGGVAAVLDDNNLWDVLDVRLSMAIVDADIQEEIQDHFLTFDVATADMRDGAIVDRYHFEPDYDENYARYLKSLWPGNPLYSADVRVDGNSVYGAAYGKLYRYRLASPTGQQPLLVASEATFLGGPYRGAVYVSRSDGVWALKPEAERIRARLVAPSSSQVSGLTIAGRTAYIAFADGELRGVDVDDGRTVLDAQPGYSARVGVSSNRVFVVCHVDAGEQVVAFRRPDSH